MPPSDTEPNVYVHATITGPSVGRGATTGDQLLEVMQPSAVLLTPAVALPENLVTWQAERIDGRYAHIREGEYLAALVYWAKQPYEDYPDYNGVASEVLPNAPTQLVSVTGATRNIDIRFDYNATGSGPHHAVEGVLLLSGNPPIYGDELQLVFYPQQQSPGQTPADGYVQYIAIGENNEGRREFNTVLSAGTYGVSCLGAGMCNHASNDREPVELAVQAPVEGFTLYMRNNWGSRPPSLGVIRGELDLTDWDPAAPITIVATRDHYKDLTGDASAGAITGIWSDGFHGFHDEAVWHVTEADIRDSKASFMLGWLNDGNYTIAVYQGQRSKRHLPQVTLSPASREISALQID